MDSFKVASEDTTVHMQALKKGDMYIVVQWLIHDKWDRDTRQFVKEDVPPYVLWQQGAIIPVKGLGSITAGRTTYALSAARHKAIMALLTPAGA